MESLDRNNMFACTCDLEMDDVGRKPIETFLEAQIPSVGDIRAGRQNRDLKSSGRSRASSGVSSSKGAGAGADPLGLPSSS